MPDSSKSTVLIASVLKPVDDSRMYEKIGLSLACSGRYEVHIMGCESETIADAKICQHSFKPFRRMSIGRFLAPWKILFEALRLKPDVFIICTHELLFLAVFLKLVSGCRMIYDVQENYYWNILYTPAFPLLLKPFVALYVRGKETLTSRYVDHFLLAERGYEHELKFTGKRKTVLENKVRINPALRKSCPTGIPGKSLKLLFSGTLAETTGVFTAIDLAIKLHLVDEGVKLTIIGSCAQRRVLEKIQMLIKPRPFIELIAEEKPIPHSRIFQEIQKADLGLVTYEINPSTMNSIPTKLYEYLGFRLPILLVNHKPWVDFCHPWSAAVVFDNTNIDASAIYHELTQHLFYTAEPAAVYWETEEPKLFRVLEALAK
jgi:glycosyltransferase involved in cell wall biosynthesis